MRKLSLLVAMLVCVPNAFGYWIKIINNTEYVWDARFAIQRANDVVDPNFHINLIEGNAKIYDWDYDWNQRDDLNVQQATRIDVYIAPYSIVSIENTQSGKNSGLVWTKAYAKNLWKSEINFLRVITAKDEKKNKTITGVGDRYVVIEHTDKKGNYKVLNWLSTNRIYDLKENKWNHRKDSWWSYMQGRYNDYMNLVQGLGTDWWNVKSMTTAQGDLRIKQERDRKAAEEKATAEAKVAEAKAKQEKIDACNVIIKAKLDQKGIDNLKQEIEKTNNSIKLLEDIKKTRNLMGQEPKDYDEQKELLKKQQGQLDTALQGAQNYKKADCQKILGKPY